MKLNRKIIKIIRKNKGIILMPSAKSYLELEPYFLTNQEIKDDYDRANKELQEIPLGKSLGLKFLDVFFKNRIDGIFIGWHKGGMGGMAEEIEYWKTEYEKLKTLTDQIGRMA